MPAGVQLLPRPLRDQLLLLDEAITQGVMVSSPLKALTSAGHDPDPVSQPQDSAAHPHISQCRLQHWPLNCLLQDQATTQKAPQFQAEGQTSHQYHQHAVPRESERVCQVPQRRSVQSPARWRMLLMQSVLPLLNTSTLLRKIVAWLGIFANMLI